MLAPGLASGLCVAGLRFLVFLVSSKKIEKRSKARLRRIFLDRKSRSTSTSSTSQAGPARNLTNKST